MARRIEEEESYWPGFVDALSTIVMVVTFLLIILGVAIFAISTQVSKAVSDSNAATAKAKSEIAESQANLEEQAKAAEATLEAANTARDAAQAVAAQAATVQQDSQSEASRLAEALAESKTESQQMAAQLQAASQTVATQAEQLTAQQQAAAELSQKAQTAEAALSKATAEAAQTQSELEQTKQALESKEQEVSKLSQSVATLSQSSAASVTQKDDVAADNALRISSTTYDIDPTQIVVAAEQTKKDTAPVEVTSAHEVLTVKFQDGAIDLTVEAAEQAQSFVDTNRAVLQDHTISLWSFYDGQSLSVTQAKRTAYFRLLAVRNILLTAGFNADEIDISVRVSETPEDVDTVKTFLQ